MYCGCSDDWTTLASCQPIDIRGCRDVFNMTSLLACLRKNVSGPSSKTLDHMTSRGSRSLVEPTFMGLHLEKRLKSLSFQSLTTSASKNHIDLSVILATNYETDIMQRRMVGSSRLDNSCRRF